MSISRLSVCAIVASIASVAFVSLSTGSNLPPGAAAPASHAHQGHPAVVRVEPSSCSAVAFRENQHDYIVTAAHCNSLTTVVANDGAIAEVGPLKCKRKDLDLEVFQVDWEHPEEQPQSRFATLSTGHIDAGEKMQWVSYRQSAHHFATAAGTVISPTCTSADDKKKWGCPPPNGGWVGRLDPGNSVCVDDSGGGVFHTDGNHALTGIISHRMTGHDGEDLLTSQDPPCSRGQLVAKIDAALISKMVAGNASCGQ